LLSNLAVEILLDPEEAIGNADEVMSAYDKFGAQEENGADDGEDLRPVDVILDMLISFLAKPSALWKRLAEQTFAVFSGLYTKDSLDLILNVSVMHALRIA
jgi:DNA polymerase phi